MSTTTPRPVDALRRSLETLATELEAFSFQVPGPQQPRAETDRKELVRSIREYLLPRLRDPDAPVVAVLVGPTGSGKSVLLNSLAGAPASATGPLRPTTRTPVVWAHRKHARRYQQGFLPQLGGEAQIAAGDDELTEQLTVIDAPDFHSVNPDSRRVADDLLAVADLCVFVASGMRYADATAWDFLAQVRRRGLPILFVLNRLGPDEAVRRALLRDFARLLYENDLLLQPDDNLIFGISEQVIYPRNRALPPQAVAPIRRELALISDPALRAEVVRQSTEGAVADVIDRTETLSNYLDREAGTVEQLRAAMSTEYDRELATVFREAGRGRFVKDISRGDHEAMKVELAAAMTRRAGEAARSAAARWSELNEGTALLEIAEGLWRHGSDVPAAAASGVDRWYGELETLIAARGRRRGRRHLRDALFAFVVGGADSPILAKLEAKELDSLSEAAFSLLKDVFAEVLQTDRKRFESVLSRLDQPPGTASKLRGLAAQLSVSAGEFYQ